ncbi:MAG: DUF1849 family protein [Hyphomicrobiales bacterium]|nr:DUF1849 family protein [Hyphomicrobiales bacterium]
MRQLFNGYVIASFMMMAPAALAAPAAALATRIMPLAAHQAVYDLALVPGTGPQSPAGARGRIVYRFTGSSCLGYQSQYRQMTQIEPSGASTRLSDVVSDTFEDGNGKSFRFKLHSTINDRTDQEIDGSARVGTKGGVDVTLQSPKPEQFGFKQDVLFPTGHIQHIIAAALAGQKTLSARIYDGSETGRKTYDTFTVIGKVKVGKAANKVAQIGDLASVPRWPVTVSYFDHESHKDKPDYVLSFDLYENGISRRLKLDYGTFAFTGTLVHLKLLPPAAPCP